jgi:hypothetical protein
MEKIVNIQNVDPNTLQLQNYSSADESLISNSIINIAFNPSEDYLEYFILDLNQNVLFGNTAGYPGYQIQDRERKGNHKDLKKVNIIQYIIF